PTGCTVFSFPSGPVPCSVDVRGGSPAVSGAGIDFVDAICLAGGSLYGLEAAAGVAAEELARREYRTDWLSIPLVAGAIIFDWGPRDNAVYPDKELGRAALRSARPGAFPLGARGAGRSARASCERSAGRCTSRWRGRFSRSTRSRTATCCSHARPAR